MTGAGKSTTSLLVKAAMFGAGSAIYVSPKPEIADFILGRRVDPRVFSEERFPEAERGINPAGITSARYHTPNGRAFVIGSNQSVYDACRYDFLSDIDLKAENARALLLAVASGSFPDRPKNSSTDPWFTNTPRGLVAAACGHVLSVDPNSDHHNLPWIVERLMGIDPETGFASPKYFEMFLKGMLKNNALDGFVQSAASNVFQLGEKAFGSINSELENNCRWITDSSMRKQLVGSDFSFHWVGHDEAPVTVFAIPQRGRAAFQASIPWLRTVAELSLEILASRKKAPKNLTRFIGDEYRSWGAEVSAISNGITLLRDKLKLWLYVQSFSQLVDMFGENGAAEFESSCTMQYFGCNDLVTAERISRRLGKRAVHYGSGSFQTNDVITPAEVMQELRLSSNQQYVFPAGALPMRLERVAFKPLHLNDGGRFRGLPLEGHYDDGLTRESFNRMRS